MMKKIVWAVLLAALLAAEPNPSRTDVIAYLQQMRATEHGMMNVDPAEGQYLSDVVRKLNARRALEIGTSNGYSGIWLALGLRDTGGALITIDIDPGRRSLALKNFKNAGVAEIVDSRLADALQEIPKIPGPFDFVFIDAWKPDYIKYLHLVLPKVRTGGVIAAHNVKSHAGEMQDFLEAIRNAQQFKTEFVTLGPSGLSISYKK